MFRRVAMVGVILVVLLSMLPGVVPVSGQDDGTPVVEEPLQPEVEESPTPEGSPDAIARQIDDNDPTDTDPPETGRIEITAYQCLQQGFELPDEAAEFDAADPGTGSDDVVGNLPEEVYAGDSEFDGCTPDYTGKQFEIAVRGNAPRNQVLTTEGYPAKVIFAGAFPEPLYIMSPAPQNFRRDSVVVCTSSVAGPMRFEGADSDYGIVQYDLQVDETLVCNWYFIQLQVPGTIVITSRWCQQDYLPPDDLATLQAQCTDVMERVEIAASPQGGQMGAFRQVAGDGTVRFDDIGPGTWVLTQESMGLFDAPAVFCRSRTAGLPGTGRWFPIGIFGDPANSVTVTVEPDATVSCMWFVAKNGFARITSGNTSLGFAMIGCPASFDPVGATIYDYAESCHEEIPAIDVTIRQPIGATVSGTSSGGIPNLLFFDDLAGIPVEATLSPVDGYASVAPNCDPRLDGIAGNGPMGFVPVSGPTNTTFTVPLLPDLPNGLTQAYCTVFFMPPQPEGPRPTIVPNEGIARETATGNLIVTVHTCPSGTEPNADLAVVCGEPAADVPFTALSTADDTVQATSAGEVIASASFEGLTAGAWTVSQGDVDDFPQSVVICDGIASAAIDGATTVTIEAGATVVCDWYLVPRSRLQGN